MHDGAAAAHEVLAVLHVVPPENHDCQAVFHGCRALPHLLLLFLRATYDESHVVTGAVNGRQQILGRLLAPPRCQGHRIETLARSLFRSSSTPQFLEIGHEIRQYVSR